MSNSKKKLHALTAVLPLAFALQACSTYQQESVDIALAPAADAVVATGPALWQVADEDTTIYLFGTVHALPKDVDWFKGPIATALGSSDMLVTEIPASATSDPAAQQMIAMKAMLPPEETLRATMSESEKATYETALTSLGVPVNAFDRFEPWFAGINLAMLPLMMSGWTPESGVEKIIEGEAGQEIARDALETVDYQIGLFDTLPQESQVAFLMTTAEGVDEVVPMMEKMLEEWLEGDADGLAEYMNKGLSDPVLAKALLHDRNANWAEWIEARMEQPGTVFIAVGAGHLAGEKSVQHFLALRDLSVTRIQ